MLRKKTAITIPVAALITALSVVLIPGCGGRTEQAADEAESPRVLLFGVDAATWNVLGPMIEDGELPVISSLIERGSSGILKTGEPIQSPQMWTSIATGVVPEKHGITQFMAEIPESGLEVPVTSNMRRVKAFWNILSDAGITVGIVGWWPSWPAEEVNGFMIAQRAWPVNWSRGGIPYGATRDSQGNLVVDSFPGRTYPEEAYEEFEPFIVTEEDVTTRELAALFSPRGRYTDALKLFHASWVYAKDKTFAQAGLDFLVRYEPDVFAVYLQGTDVVSHYYWGYQRDFGYDVSDDDYAKYGRVVRHYYQYVDFIIGRYLEEVGDDVTVLLVSDHGFETKPDLKERWERGEEVRTVEGGKDVPWDHGVDGVFIMAGPGIKAGNKIGPKSVVDVTPTLLAYLGLPVAEDMDGEPAVDVFEPSFLKSHPITYVPTYETGERTGDHAPMESPMDEGLKEKLRALGYIE
jgi:predicted AlkP superfamily phosphohydrolase/phosphomutase